MDEACNDINYHELILNSIPHGMALIDKQYKVKYANPAMPNRTGTSCSIESLYCYQTFNEQETSCSDCPATETFRTRKVAHVTRCILDPIPNISKPSSYKVVKISSFPVINGKEVAQCVISFRDVTDIYFLERHKEETMNMLAHDIRSPLLAAAQSLDNVVQGSYGELDEKKSIVISTTRDTCELLTAMIDDLLDIYRHEAGQFELSLSRIDLAQVIKKAVELIQLLSREKDIDLEIRINPDIQPMMGDRQRLIRTIINLLENAIKYSPVGESVQIEVENLDKSVQVSVTNQGKAIAPEHLEKIFEKYFKAECTSFAGKMGMGLGLPFCRQTIEAHGGRVWAESPLDGKDFGSRFLFTLPIAGK